MSKFHKCEVSYLKINTLCVFACTTSDDLVGGHIGILVCNEYTCVLTQLDAHNSGKVG